MLFHRITLVICFHVAFATLRLQAQQNDIAITPAADSSIVEYRNPGIVTYPTGIVCTWRETGAQAQDVLGIWDIGADTVGSHSIYHPPPIPPDGIHQEDTLVSSERWDSSAARRMPGDVGLQYNYMFLARVKGALRGGHTVVTYDSYITSLRVALVRAGAMTWKTCHTILSDNKNRYFPEFDSRGAEEHIIGFDPNGHELITLLSQTTNYVPFYKSPYTNLRGYRDGDSVWELPYTKISPLVSHAPPWTAFIPMGIARFILIDGSQARYFIERTAIDSFQLPMQKREGVKFFKLHGPYFAMTSWSIGDSASVRVQMLDTLGRSLHSVDLHRSPLLDDYVLVSAPDDSIITLLSGSAHGLHATFLTRDLHITEEDIVISATTGRVANPAGAFRGDTLFAVWEDFRQAKSRIYGTFHRASSGRELGVSIDNSTPIQQDARRKPSHLDSRFSPFAFPNPASDEIVIEANLPDRNGAMLELYTPMGEIALTRELFGGSSGVRCAVVALGDLPSGVYIARLRSGGDTTVQMMVKR